MAFAYRIDDDDQCNWNRYKYAYVAQFGEGHVKKTCAAKIELPREDGGNLRDGDNVTYFVYAESCTPSRGRRARHFCRQVRGDQL